MEESSTEPKIAEQPVEVAAQPKSNMVLLGIGAFVFILLGLAGGYFLFGNKAAKVSQSTPQPTSSVSPSVETNKTAGWRTFKIAHVGMEFKLPPSFANSEYKEEAITPPEAYKNAVTGSSLCVHVYKKSISFIPEAYAGGFGCYPDKDDVFSLGGTSPDFSAGREGTLYDMQGFIVKDQKYFANFVSSQLIDITDIAQSFNNPNSVEIVKLKGKSSEGPSLWPQEGYIGALINTKDATYKGLSVVVKLSDIDETTFDEILSTFKFTDQKHSDSSSLKTFTILQSTMVSGEQAINISASIPAGWSFVTLPRVVGKQAIIKNCSIYTITSPTNTQLMISPICEGWSASYTDWPKDAVIVNQSGSMQNTDAAVSYIVRYYNSERKKYYYVEGSKADYKVHDAILVQFEDKTSQSKNFLPMEISLTSDGKEIETVDKIVSSIKAQ